MPDFNPTPKDFEYLTVTGMINRLRQYLLDHDAARADLVASSLGGLVALHYAYRFEGISRLLLLAPLLSYGSLPLPPDTAGQWERDGITQFSHYAFPGKVSLRYDFHLDGLRYAEQIHPPADTFILHGKHDEIVPVISSRSYASRYPGRVRLLELDSDHGLLDRLETIWEHVASFLLEPAIR